jgi:short-subunit dehydrogenase
VARREDRRRALAARLHHVHGATTKVLVADLTAPEDLRQVEARIAAGPALDLLVNNAGFGGFRPFVQLDPDQAEELIDLQVLAVTRLARAGSRPCAPAWCAPSSISAWAPTCTGCPSVQRSPRRWNAPPW